MYCVLYYTRWFTFCLLIASIDHLLRMILTVLICFLFTFLVALIIYVLRSFLLFSTLIILIIYVLRWILIVRHIACSARCASYCLQRSLRFILLTALIALHIAHCLYGASYCLRFWQRSKCYIWHLFGLQTTTWHLTLMVNLQTASSIISKSKVRADLTMAFDITFH